MSSVISPLKIRPDSLLQSLFHLIFHFMSTCHMYIDDHFLLFYPLIRANEGKNLLALPTGWIHACLLTMRDSLLGSFSGYKDLGARTLLS